MIFIFIDILNLEVVEKREVIYVKSVAINCTVIDGIQLQVTINNVTLVIEELLEN
ncbi:hypothetical protein [Bacillus toyonensis]|uniref:hypothetical protein n=1 Tax=Bacillus toyonensis TaxID=155322 RepID=UPI0002E92A1A|nr:hypothetical protein [Bacillus toyonensis]